MMTAVPLEVRQLQHVAAIGQHGSFGGAARALGMSQPALSKSIKVLETALGVRLFERATSGATPTIFGHLVLSRAGALLQNLDALVVEIDRKNGLAAGTLSVGAGFFPYDHLVVPALERLARKHPGLHLRIVPVDWRTVAEQVLAGTVDIGIAGVARARSERALAVEPLRVRAATFFVRRGHPLAGAARLSLKQLAPYPFAMGPIPPRLAQNLVRAGVQGRIDPSTGDFVPAIAVNSVALMKSIVSQSDAFGAGPAVNLDTELAEGRLVALPVSAPWAVAEPGIIRLRDRPLTPAQEAFLGELRAIDRAAPAIDGRKGSRRPAPPGRSPASAAPPEPRRVRGPRVRSAGPR